MKELMAHLKESAVARLFHITIKGFAVQALEILDHQLPQPTIDSVDHAASRDFIRIRDEFFEHEIPKCRIGEFRAIFNFFILLYDNDLYYRERITWLLQEIKQIKPTAGEEKPRSTWWKEEIHA